MLKKEDAKSHFYKIKCPDCGGEQTVFDSASSIVKCNSCGKTLLKPTGGKAKFNVKEVLRLD
jgi:small subunit ribosomal protein S27e